MEKLLDKFQTGRQLLEIMLSGQSYTKALKHLAGPPPFKQARAYQLLKQARTQGQIEWSDERHGHPSKSRPQVRDWLKQLCQHSPLISSRQLQIQLLDHFNLHLSTSQINRLRVQLEVANSQASRKLQGLNKKKPQPH